MLPVLVALPFLVSFSSAWVFQQTSALFLSPLFRCQTYTFWFYELVSPSWIPMAWLSFVSSSPLLLKGGNWHYNKEDSKNALGWYAPALPNKGRVPGHATASQALMPSGKALSFLLCNMVLPKLAQETQEKMTFKIVFVNQVKERHLLNWGHKRRLRFWGFP